jgi:hypothetical protein
MSIKNKVSNSTKSDYEKLQQSFLELKKVNSDQESYIKVLHFFVVILLLFKFLKSTLDKQAESAVGNQKVYFMSFNEMCM